MVSSHATCVGFPLVFIGNPFAFGFGFALSLAIVCRGYVLLVLATIIMFRLAVFNDDNSRIVWTKILIIIVIRNNNNGRARRTSNCIACNI